MNLDDYQQEAARTIPESMTGELLYLNAVLGINGEAGEMADMLKKERFQGHEYSNDQVLNEIGDVLWYLAAACTAMKVGLGTVAKMNIAKLRRRYPAGFSEERSINRDTVPATNDEVVIYTDRNEKLLLSDWTEGCTQ